MKEEVAGISPRRAFCFYRPDTTSQEVGRAGSARSRRKQDGPLWRRPNVCPGLPPQWTQCLGPQVIRATAHSHYPGFSHRRDAQKKGHTQISSDSSFQQTGASSHLVPGWQEMDSGTHFVQDTMNHFKVLFLYQLEDSPSLARPEDLGGRAAPLARKPQGPSVFRAALQSAMHSPAKPGAENRLSTEAGASGRAATKDSPGRWHGK